MWFVAVMLAAQALCVLSVFVALGSALGWEAGWMYPVYPGPIAGGACLLYPPAFGNDRRYFERLAQVWGLVWAMLEATLLLSPVSRGDWYRSAGCLK